MRITTLTLPAFDPLLFFCKLDATQRCASLVRSGQWTVVAWNPIRTISSSGNKGWQMLQAALARRKKRKSTLPFVGGLIGYCGYDLAEDLLKVNLRATNDLQLPDMCFHEYDTAVLFDGKRVHILGDSAFVHEVRETHMRALHLADVTLPRLTAEITTADYRRAFTKIQRAIVDGDLYQLNYTYRLTGQCNSDRRRLFAMLFHRNSAPCASYMESDDCTLLSLSPERFISIDGDRILTSPIKGTRPRGDTRKDDARLRIELLKSSKEQSELAMITDLLRNDLGKICRAGSVHVRDSRLLQVNPSVWHTHSVIEGRLNSGISITDVFRSMLPGGSITGCPKKRAVEYIDALEPTRRGPYTGALAMLSDNGRVESSILIRTLIIKDKTAYLHVGGGIVADSQWKDEWDETLAKAKTFLSVDPPKPARHTSQLFSINGKRAAASNQLLRVLDPAASTYEPAVFETLRTYNHRIFALEDHVNRLEASAQLCGFRVPHSRETIAAWTQELAKDVDSDAVRIKIVATAKNILIRCEPLRIDPLDSGPIRAMFFPLERDRPQAKAMPYDACTAAHEWARSMGVTEALLVNRHGRVTEGAYSNIFWVEKGTLWTPGTSILEGITRAHVLSVAASLAIPIRFSTPSVARLLRAEEVFLTRTTIGIAPVTRIGDHVIAQGKIGRITRRLIKKRIEGRNERLEDRKK